MSKIKLKYEVKMLNGKTEVLEVTSDARDQAAFEADLKEIYGSGNVKEIA